MSVKLRTQILDIIYGDVAILPSKFTTVEFNDYIQEKFNKEIDELTFEEKNHESVIFLELVAKFNKSNSDTLIPLFYPCEDVLNKIVFFYGVKNFDGAFNCRMGSTLVPLKTIIEYYLNEVRISPMPFLTANTYDFRAIIK